MTAPQEPARWCAGCRQPRSRSNVVGFRDRRGGPWRWVCRPATAFGSINCFRAVVGTVLQHEIASVDDVDAELERGGMGTGGAASLRNLDRDRPDPALLRSDPGWSRIKRYTP